MPDSTLLSIIAPPPARFVPGAHAHILLAIGNRTLQALFPDSEAVFLKRGGRIQDLGSAMKWFYWGSFRVRSVMNYPFWCSTRPFLDKVIRDVFMGGAKYAYVT